MTEHLSPLQAEGRSAAGFEEKPAAVQTGGLRLRAESDLIRDTLMLCVQAFGTERARFIRQLTDGAWQVHALKNDALFSHRADYAEVSMAWAVGLSRFPIRVNRPRITDLGGGSVRPIAVTTYFGIPVICGDHLVGVIELAGNIGGELLRTLDTLAADLNRFGKQLTHDPSLRATQFVDLESECWIAGGCWVSGDVELSADEWAVVVEISEPEPLRAVLSRVDLDEERFLDTVRRLVGCGVVALRASTRALSEHTGISAEHDCVAACD